MYNIIINGFALTSYRLTFSFFLHILLFFFLILVHLTQFQVATSSLVSNTAQLWLHNNSVTEALEISANHFNCSPYRGGVCGYIPKYITGGAQVNMPCGFFSSPYYTVYKTIIDECIYF